MKVRALLAFASLLCVPVIVSPTTAAQAQTSENAPQTFPVIGRVHSKTFCAMFEEAVAPAMLALTENDRLIAKGHETVAAMLRDRVTSAQAQPEFSGQADLARNHLGALVRRLADNERIVNRIVRNGAAFPRSDDAAENALAAQLREQLGALADKQNEAANIIGGVVETEMDEEMLAQTDTNMASATAPRGSSGNWPGSGGRSFAASPLAVYDSTNLAESDVIGHRRYDRWLAAIGESQTAIRATENGLTPVIVQRADECAAARADRPPDPGP